MRLMKKVLAMSMVTAIVFTSFELPVSATAASTTQTEVVQEAQPDAVSQAGDLANSETDNQSTATDTKENTTVEETTDNQSTTTKENPAVSEKEATDSTTTEVNKEAQENTTTDSTATENQSTVSDAKTTDNKEISKVQKQFNDALLENGTITLSEDLQIEEMLELALPKDTKQANITIELSGHKISSEKAQALIHVAENVTLTIKGEGSIESSAQNGIVIFNEGIINLDHADLVATGSKSIGVLNDSSLLEKGLIIKSGTIKADWLAIGKTAKAEVSKNRPTAFFAAAGIVLPTGEQKIEQGNYSLDENASVIEESSNSIEVNEKLQEETKEPADKTQEDTQNQTVQQETVPNTQTVPSIADSNTTDTNKNDTTANIVAPEVPANISAAVQGYNSIKITWNVVANANGYIIERIQTGAENEYKEINKVTASEYTDTNVLVGKEYKYRVYAYITNQSNEILKSIASTEVAAKTTIGVPQSLEASQSSATSVDLTWKNVEGAVQYNVYRADKNKEYQLIATTNSTEYNDSGLKTGTKYSYKITAINGDFQSDSSDTVSLFAAAAGVTKLKAKSSDYNRIDLSWKKAKGATKYIIYRSTNETSGFKKIQTVTDKKYSDSVKTGVTYYYKIVSYSDKSKGGESAVVSATAVCKAPTNVKATSKAYNSAKITWSKTGGASKYIIYRSTSKNGEYTKVGSVSKGKSDYTDKTVVTGTKYYYKVVASAKGVEGELSKAANVKIKPANLKNLEVKSAGEKNTTLTWKKSKGAQSYVIYRSTSEKKNYNQIAETSDLTYTDTNLKNGKTYYYRVYAKAGNITGDYAQTSYVNPKNVYLSSDSLELGLGEKSKLTVSFKPSNVSDGSITWSSSNTGVATVSKKGVVKAIAVGVTTITATTINGLTATCAVTVGEESSKVVVVLDPGHGGSDSGTFFGSMKEKDLNLKISNYTKEELEKYNGIKVVMTRTDDTFIKLEDRPAIAKENGADFFVSQHINSGPAAARGSEVYVSLKGGYNEPSSKMALGILGELRGAGLTSRGVKTRRSDDGVNDYYSVIRNSVARGIPGIITEYAFLSNSEDRALLSTESGLKQMGVATATAIAKYYGLSKK